MLRLLRSVTDGLDGPAGARGEILGDGGVGGPPGQERRGGPGGVVREASNEVGARDSRVEALEGGEDTLKASGRVGAFLDGGPHGQAASVRVAVEVSEGEVPAAGEEEDASEGEEQQSGVPIHGVDCAGVRVRREGAHGLPVRRPRRAPGAAHVDGGYYPARRQIGRLVMPGARPV